MDVLKKSIAAERGKPVKPTPQRPAASSGRQAKQPARRGRKTG
jgi:hypothetical protein